MLSSDFAVYDNHGSEDEKTKINIISEIKIHTIFAASVDEKLEGESNPGSQLEEIINSSQIAVSSETISENSPEEWFLKYKHQKAKTRLCAKKLSRARTELDNVREENSRLKSMNNDLLMNLRAVSSELQSTLDKTNSRIRSVTN